MCGLYQFKKLYLCDDIIVTLLFISIGIIILEESCKAAADYECGYKTKCLS